MTTAGRFAPSPSGTLHVGNLRTALLAWLFARTTGRTFRIRMENLDRTALGADTRQLADLAALGIDWDEPVIYQTDRLDMYRSVIAELTDAGETFECFCTRREILEAPSAPHAPEGAYPGTCRELTTAQRAEKIAAGRPPAIRLRSAITEFTVIDTQLGEYTGMVDDFVICRGDGTPAYNLAVVVDDAARGRGVGEALNRHAIALAGSLGATTIDLTSRPSREAANRLYRRIGFEPRETNVYRYQGD